MEMFEEIAKITSEDPPLGIAHFVLCNGEDCDRYQCILYLFMRAVHIYAYCTYLCVRTRKGESFSAYIRVYK